MVATLSPGKTWNGRYFFGHTDKLRSSSDEFFFREYGKGVLVGFTPEEWSVLAECVRAGDEVRRIAARLGRTGDGLWRGLSPDGASHRLNS